MDQEPGERARRAERRPCQHPRRDRGDPGTTGPPSQGAEEPSPPPHLPLTITQGTIDAHPQQEPTRQAPRAMRRLPGGPRPPTKKSGKALAPAVNESPTPRANRPPAPRRKPKSNGKGQARQAGRGEVGQGLEARRARQRRQELEVQQEPGEDAGREDRQDAGYHGRRSRRGAITGAARNLADEPTAMPLYEADLRDEAPGGGGHSDASTTTDVLGEMASGAALGALTGAAKVVMPRSPRRARSGAG